MSGLSGCEGGEPETKQTPHVYVMVQYSVKEQ